MTQIYSEGVPPQGILIYKLLISRGPLKATEIAIKLRVKPQAVYRVLDHLNKIGLIKETSNRPKIFSAINLTEARDAYANIQKLFFDNLMRDVKESNEQNTKPNFNQSLFSVTFISGREEIFAKIADDINKTNEDCKFIVLGLPIGISQELLLAQKQAIDRGVEIKIIIQEFSKKNEVVVKSWMKAGMKLRIGNAINFHLLLIGNSISYLMTYGSDDKTRRDTVRIGHKSINRELQRIFNHHWEMAEDIKFLNNI